MARPKVVVAAAALHPSIHTYPHPPSSVPSKEWSFGDPSRRDCGRVSFSPSLCGRRISYSSSPSSPPSSSSSSSSSSPGLCSELDLIVAKDSFVFLWQTREGEKEGRKGRIRIYSSEEVMRRSSKCTTSSLLWAFPQLIGGDLRTATFDFAFLHFPMAQYGISSPFRLRCILLCGAHFEL